MFGPQWIFGQKTVLQQRPFGNLVLSIELRSGRKRPRCPEKNLLASVSYETRLHVKGVRLMLSLMFGPQWIFGRKTVLQQRPFGNLVLSIELRSGRKRPRCPEKNLLVSASYDPRLHVKAEVDVAFHVGQKKRSLFGQKIVLQQRPFGNLVPPIELGSGRKWPMRPTIPS